METKKLRRSLTDSVIGGVAGGLGEYFGTDPVIFRILFIVLTFTGGGGVLIYLLMWIFIPKAEVSFVDDAFKTNNDKKGPESSETTDSFEEMNLEDESEGKQDFNQESINLDKVKKRKNGNIIGGVLLITIGLFFLADDLFPWLSWEYLWPAALIIVGLAIIKMNFKAKNEKIEDHGKS